MEKITAVISTLDGVTTVLVAFLFVCLIFPSIVKNRSQYFAALAVVIVMIILHSLTLMLASSPGFVVAAGAFTGFLQAIALILLVLSVGGLTARQLAGDMAKAYEVMRRGETEKEVIIPIGGQGAGRRSHDEDQHTVYHIDSGPTPDSAEPHVEEHPDKGIPLS